MMPKDLGLPCPDAKQDWTCLLPPLAHTAFPGALWPAVPQTQAASLLALQAQLSESERADPDAIRALQFHQIGALIAHADRIPFWRRRLRDAGISAGKPIDATAWARLPPLTRSDMQRAGDRLLAPKLPQGHGRTSGGVTSGSSGKPVRLTRSELDHFYWQGFVLREHLWRGRDFAGTFMGILRDDGRTRLDETAHIRRLPDWGPPVATVYPTGPALLLDYRAPIPALVAAIVAEAPDYLSTFPSLLLEILRHARANAITLPPLREAIAVGEAAPPELAALCREVWNAPLTATYSAFEAGCIAFQCPEHGAWHVQSEANLIEVLDDDNRPCAPGETGRVIVTPLHNFAMPLLRYDIGDLAIVGAGCACGRTLPVLAAIPGRARDLIVLPSGDLRPAYYGHGAIMQVDAIMQHQVAQTAANEIVLRLVVRRPLTAAEETHILSSAAAALGHPFDLRIDYVPEIARRPSGKFAEFEGLPGA
ncbi:MAG: phenylacetate-CoA ligase [Paracoccaceae bacterium]|jgi:phenylacetate-CoA ligase